MRKAEVSIPRGLSTSRPGFRAPVAAPAACLPYMAVEPRLELGRRGIFRSSPAFRAGAVPLGHSTELKERQVGVEPTPVLLQSTAPAARKLAQKESPRFLVKSGGLWTVDSSTRHTEASRIREQLDEALWMIAIMIGAYRDGIRHGARKPRRGS